LEFFVFSAFCFCFVLGETSIFLFDRFMNGKEKEEKGLFPDDESSSA
jgi:hypothetical protein